MKLELDVSDDFSLSSKLDGLPKIVYRSHDGNHFNIEEQLEIWGISNYRKHENKYSDNNYLEWKDLVLDKGLMQDPIELAFTMNVIDSIVSWYDNCDDEYAIFCSEDLSFDCVKYWLFDWKFLMNNLPYNWDCIQLSAYSRKTLKMHVHPYIGSMGYKCFMVTRYFAKRLKHYHYIDGKYRLHYYNPNKSILQEKYGSLDEFFYDLGITYTFPIFSHRPPFANTKRTMLDVCDEGVEYWWRYKAPSFSNFELFHYKKGDDEWKMELQFESEGPEKLQVWMDARRGVTIWT